MPVQTKNVTNLRFDFQPYSPVVSVDLTEDECRLIYTAFSNMRFDDLFRLHVDASMTNGREINTTYIAAKMFPALQAFRDKKA